MAIDCISSNISQSTKKSMEQKCQSLFLLSSSKISKLYNNIYISSVPMTIDICTLMGFVDGIL